MSMAEALEAFAECYWRASAMQHRGNVTRMAKTASLCKDSVYSHLKRSGIELRQRKAIPAKSNPPATIQPMTIRTHSDGLGAFISARHCGYVKRRIGNTGSRAGPQPDQGAGTHS